jgi:hypothetical protein
MAMTVLYKEIVIVEIMEKYITHVTQHYISPDNSSDDCA